MEQNKTKTWQTVLGLVILAVAIIYFVKMPRTAPPENNIEDVVENPNIDAAQFCYIWNTEAGDEAKLSMDIRGQNVIGEFYWLPAEKDSKTGIFKGIVALDPDNGGSKVDALWEATGEGVTNTEELKIVFAENIATVGFGEMKEENGVYVYADPENIFYGPNLQMTDCGDEAMD